MNGGGEVKWRWGYQGWTNESREGVRDVEEMGVGRRREDQTNVSFA